MQLPLDKLAVLFARVRGRKGSVLELRAILSTAAERTIIGWQDALRLGYIPEFGARGGGVEAIAPPGIIQARPLKLEEVEVGDVRAREVEALVFELPDQAGIDLILGYSFLKNFRVVFDYPRRLLHLELPGEGV